MDHIKDLQPGWTEEEAYLKARLDYMSLSKGTILEKKKAALILAGKCLCGCGRKFLPGDFRYESTKRLRASLVNNPLDAAPGSPIPPNPT